MTHAAPAEVTDGVPTLLPLVEEFLRRKHPDMPPLDPDLDLVAHRLLDSLDFLELLMELEDFTGEEITVDDVGADDLRTVRIIAERFLT